MEKRFGPVRFIQGANTGKYPYSNSVYVEGAGVLIDAAAGAEVYHQLRQGPGIKEVWLTHFHEDHVAYLDMFADLPLVQMEAEAVVMAGGAPAYLDWYGFQNPAYREYWLQVFQRDFSIRPRRAARYFKPDEIIDLGPCSVQVLHTPGHTPGHCAFFFREPAVLFLGDYDLTPFGPWYGDRDGSIEETIASVNRLRQIPARVWLGGHEAGCFIDNPDELFDRYLAVIDQREEKLLDFLRTPHTFNEIRDHCIVYRKPREPKAFFEWGEGAIMTKHIERAIKQGRITLDDERYRRI